MDRILLIDDEQAVLDGQRRLLSLHGYSHVSTARSAQEARSAFSDGDVALAILDLALNGESGLQLLSWITAQWPETVVLVITGASDIKTAVECMRAGAYDFLVKGTDSNRIPAAVRNALEHRNALRENARLREALVKPELENPGAFSRFITDNEQVRRIFRYLEIVAPLSDPVLITGETGVGKEIVARAVHETSGREGRFVAVNLGGLDDHVVSDTLFGHLRGAFTGADSNREGLVKTASGGTLFLDEVAELSMESQVKLLRLLDSGEFLPLGADRAEHSSARVVLATNRDLEAAIEQGRFRRDLYFRISSHHARVPPLRERPEDIPPIVSHLANLHATRLGREEPELDPELVQRLRERRLPGNVRELDQLVMNAVITGEWQGLRAGDRPRTGQEPESPALESTGAGIDVAATKPPPAVDTETRVAFGASLPTPAEAIEALLKEADRRFPNNRRKAAQAVGLSPQAFANRWRRMEESDRSES
jgi:DNA-binding NtrC family response regulator